MTEPSPAAAVRGAGERAAGAAPAERYLVEIAREEAECLAGAARGR